MAEISAKNKIRGRAVERLICNKYKDAGIQCEMVPNSGSNPLFPGDIQTKTLLIECKTSIRETKLGPQLYLPVHDFAQIEHEAATQNKVPVLHFKHKRQREVWTFVKWQDWFKEDGEELEEAKEGLYTYIFNNHVNLDLSSDCSNILCWIECIPWVLFRFSTFILMCKDRGLMDIEKVNENE